VVNNGAARFDDMTGRGPSLVLEGLQDVLVAHHPGDVVAVLEAASLASAAGEWVAGYLSYEAASGLNPALTVYGDDPVPGDPPLAWFGVFADCRQVSPVVSPAGSERPYSAAPWELDVDQAHHAAQMAIIREHLAAGDTYQCNLTARFRSRVEGDLFELYRDLAIAQRAPHCAYLDTGRFVVASASPELFFEWMDDRLTTRPMKGTAVRGPRSESDAKTAAALRSSAKERAENVMIVDLLRNDLGQISMWGTVEVPSLWALERYETVWQMTSTVTGRPRVGTGLVDIMRALFPSGSVTGAPKARTMQLIAEVEDSRRGVYCGAIGWMGPPSGSGDLQARFNVAIRTVVVDRQTGAAVYGSGGGIIWDSEAAAEYRELRAKAAILEAPPGEFELIETMAFVPDGGLRNRERHLGRLADSADYFGFAWSLDAVVEGLDSALVGVTEPRRVRLLLHRWGQTDVSVAAMPAASSGPVRLALDPEPVQSASAWLYHKTTRRQVYVERAARHPDADDVILQNERGELTETTIANLAVCLDGRWWTPPVEVGCLPGVERARLLDEGRLAERVLFPNDLRVADGLAVMNSLRGWRPAVLDR
jgi:para-aminobenzoate synthetase/4-amino-4-deoxychorismate lyase